MPKSIRAFIAFDLPEQVVSAISNIQADVKSDKFNIKCVRPENIHLTLKFLGNINPAAVEQIGAVMREAVKPFSPFNLQAKGLGVFPGLKRPRVIWIGVGGQIDLLIGLQKKLDEDLSASGFPREKRPFKGHLTLGRLKGKIDSDQIAAVVKKYSDFESENFTAEAIILYSSDLQPSGAVYTQLVTIPL